MTVCAFGAAWPCGPCQGCRDAAAQLHAQFQAQVLTGVFNSRGDRMMFPKGKTRKVIKAAKDRRAAKVEKSVRAQCVSRDGSCRLRDLKPGDMSTIANHRCQGPSEHAHLGKMKRARTRDMSPEDRHTTGGSCMLCRSAHQQYDAGLVEILGDADEGLSFSLKGAPIDRTTIA